MKTKLITILMTLMITVIGQAANLDCTGQIGHKNEGFGSGYDGGLEDNWLYTMSESTPGGIQLIKDRNIEVVVSDNPLVKNELTLTILMDGKIIQQETKILDPVTGGTIGVYARFTTYGTLVMAGCEVMGDGHYDGPRNQVKEQPSATPGNHSSSTNQN